MAEYSITSPYGSTGKDRDGYLGPFRIRPIPALSDDFLYTVEPQFNRRPDLLAYAIYDDPKLWWVFAQRNPDQIEDPIYDFKPGVTVKLPKKENVLKDLGL